MTIQRQNVIKAAAEPAISVSVCICTYKRPAMLKRLLEKLAEQETGGRFAFSIVIADNDREESARQVVAEFKATSSIPAIYCVQPQQNIALTRNKALENASGDFVAFIDDDEFPEKYWLATLLQACEANKVDGVLGPVRPFFEQEPPAWLRRGRFCERPEHQTGSILGWRDTRTGNVLFRRCIIQDVPEPFRRELGNGGEDQDFFRRMMGEGHRFAWCNEAVAYETVPPQRWKRGYLFKRALLRGQNERHSLTIRSVAKSLIVVPIYLLLLPFLLLLGHHLFMGYAVKLLDHAGKLLGAVGIKPLGERYLNG